MTDVTSVMPTIDLPLEDAFALTDGTGTDRDVASVGFERCRSRDTSNWDARVDRFATAGASCAFLRVRAPRTVSVAISLAGTYRIEQMPAGGWLLAPASGSDVTYWLPVAPKARRLDRDGHILEEHDPVPSGLHASSEKLQVLFDVVETFCLDIVAWRFEPGTRFADELQQLSTLETQPLFMWSSHTRYCRPADLYAHLVFGHVYENHTVWPRYWKVCSELDAYALYVALTGLAQATGKRLYALFEQQVVHSVIARQAADGGWYHGEWTEDMESHYRLVNAAVLMLAAFLERHDDNLARSAIDKAASFLVSRAQRLDVGMWFPHDSLEANMDGVGKYPFAWAHSTALGKTPTNMLILNTHLDTIVALDRHREVTGDRRYDAQIESARQAARAVLGLKTAENLYRMLFRALDLTLLPKAEAARLPRHQRALKRVGWKYLAPRLYRIKARLPRLVMPNGFVDRSLCQAGFSTRYQSVHVWDLVRYLRRFPDEEAVVKPIVLRAIDYTQGSTIRAHWKEAPERQDALGFWVEALYHLCMTDRSPKYRAWLAEAVVDVEDLGLGLPPSVLGSNPEAVRPGEAVPCLVPTEARLRVINLSRGDTVEWLVVNPTSRALTWRGLGSTSADLKWVGTGGESAPNDKGGPAIQPRSWLHCAGTRVFER